MLDDDHYPPSGDRPSRVRPGGHPPGPTALVLLGEVARRFHLQGSSKIQIAADLGLSRFKVARLLEEAAQRRIVQVSVVVPGGADPERSVRLARALGLERAVVVDVPVDDEDVVRRHVGSAVASLLEELLVEDEVLGLTWSRTLAHASQALTRLPRCTVVQLAGALHGEQSTGTVEIVRRAATVGGGRALPVYAPLVTADAGTAAALRRDPGIRGAFSRIDDLTTAVIAIGAWEEGVSTIWDAVSPADREAGVRAGACAEISGRLLDVDGRPVLSTFDDRVMALRLEQLERVPEVVAVASGVRRMRATLAAVRTGYLSTLVVDVPLADALLAEADAQLEAQLEARLEADRAAEAELVLEARRDGPADPEPGAGSAQP